MVQIKADLEYEPNNAHFPSAEETVSKAHVDKNKFSAVDVLPAWVSIFCLSVVNRFT